MDAAPEMTCPECGGNLTHVGSNEVQAGVPEVLVNQYDHYECPECESRYQYSHVGGRLRSVESD